MLLEHGAAAYECNPSSEATNTPLKIAVRYGADLDIIKLLSKAHDNEQFRNDVGPTALSVAACSGHTSTVQYFLDRELNLEDRHIGEAAENGHLEALRLFLSNGFEFDHTRLDSLLRPLTLAACNKHYAVTELLEPTCSKMVMQSGNTSALSTLLGVAAFCGWEDTVREILDQDQDFDPDNTGRDYGIDGWNPDLKPLGRAAQNGHYGVVEKLLDYGAMASPMGYIGNAPLLCAI